MRIEDSNVIKTSISKLFPIIMTFSFYMFSYGANSPGGGFQAGVIFGTIVVVTEVLFDVKVFSDTFYSLIEIAGVILLIIIMIGGLIISGFLFGRFYEFQHSDSIYSNIFIWVISFAIYIEVSGSIVLIFRNFIGANNE